MEAYETTAEKFISRAFDDAARNMWNSAASRGRDFSLLRRSVLTTYAMARWIYDWAENDTPLRVLRLEGPILLSSFWELPDELEEWRRDAKADRFVAKLAVMDEADGADGAEVIILTSSDKAYTEALLRFSDLDLNPY